MARLRWVDPWLLLAITVGATLRLTRLGDFHNPYYTATVASMLRSPHNLFYGSFDPLGVVTVDKPPFAFWVQAIPAAIPRISTTATNTQGSLGVTLNRACPKTGWF